MVNPNQLAADFRSDTLTLPSDAMKQAMMQAELGDDVFSEDPTVNQLQEAFAERMGMQAAMFFPTGSMANLVALMVHAKPGTVLYAGATSHIHHYELGGYARIAGLALKEVNDSSGFLDQEDLEKKWNPGIYYMPQPGLVTVENTHNMLGGKIFPVEKLVSLRAFTNQVGVPLHMDGARLLHAAAGAKKDPKQWTAHVDSVMISISKGLGCPVGSVLCGSQAFITQARVTRKLLGGGMRQAGVIAAAGLFALENNLEALAKDIARCRAVYQGLPQNAKLEFVEPHTNILIGQLAKAQASELVDYLGTRQIKALAISPDRVRFVFHLNNTDRGCLALSEALNDWVTA